MSMRKFRTRVRRIANDNKNHEWPVRREGKNISSKREAIQALSETSAGADRRELKNSIDCYSASHRKSLARFSLRVYG